MAGKVTFILGIHNHQPVGNFDHVIEDAYRRAYLPFIEVMKDYPGIPFSLHNSGILWDWFSAKHPEYIETVATMVSAGRVELMSAGYYEPILTVIPERDRQGQLSMMGDFLRERFGKTPRGCWLTERIWDPNLPDTLARAGLEYVVVDDSHFKSAGFRSEEMKGSFFTEDNGSFIRVFPIDRKLRYLIPFHQPGEVIEYLRRIAAMDTAGGNVAVLADDGEKFGLWTGTYNLCYVENWLRRFCDLLMENRDWLEVRTFSPVVDSTPPLGIVYLPTASYSEMMEWALPLRAQRSYHEAKDILSASGRFEEPAEAVRGGLWRNFLVKYEESNWMHKRMLGVSSMVGEFVRSAGEAAGAKAFSHLYQAQCNCAYWHGLFGGLYLPHLRSAVFHHLIEAENAVAGDRRGRGVEYATRDIDGDGTEETAVSTPSIRAFFKKRGAVLRELDSLDPAFNVTDTLTRREEFYHGELLKLAERGAGRGCEAVSIHDMACAKEEGLEKSLFYDRLPRASLVDHFLADGTGIGALAGGLFEDMGDFSAGHWDLETRVGKGKVVLEFSRGGIVSQPGGPVKVSVMKSITVEDSTPSLDVRYTIIPSGGRLKARFAVESVFSMLAGNAPDRYFLFPGREVAERHLASSGEEAGVSSVSMVDEWLDLSVTMEFEPAALFWRFPVETVSNSDSGFERVYQGSAVVPVRDLDLDDGEPAAFGIVIRLGRAKIGRKERPRK